MFAMQPFIAHRATEHISLAPNSLGLDPSENLVLFMLLYNWENPGDDDIMHAAAKNLIGRIEEATKEAGRYNQFKYLNYAAPWQDPIKSYGEEIVRELKAVSRKYDPEGMFQIQCPGGFKLWR